MANRTAYEQLSDDPRQGLELVLGFMEKLHTNYPCETHLPETIWGNSARWRVVLLVLQHGRFIGTDTPVSQKRLYPREDLLQDLEGLEYPEYLDHLEKIERKNKLRWWLHQLTGKRFFLPLEAEKHPLVIALEDLIVAGWLLGVPRMVKGHGQTVQEDCIVPSLELLVALGGQKPLREW